MDFDQLKNQVSNLSLYDLKAGVRKVQNAVMNYTEMESKVREATNNEPWGASSTLMQEIANGTFNYGTLNEIMPMIYKRFTEKAAEEWRQIYKALQLLEFLIKNGSERVIDDARSHLSLLKMLKQFHFIDQNGKDQGLNVRNRAKELTELLSDVDRIRAERKKSRTTRNKYSGVEGGTGMGGSMSSSANYGGNGRDNEYGSYSGGVYGDGGGFGGNTSHFSDSQARKDRFEEYDEYDEGAVASTSRRKAEPSSRRPAQKSETPKKKEPEVDLFSFGDEDIVSPSSSSSKNAISSGASNDFGVLQSAPGDDDDDFDDFQSALPSGSSGNQLGSTMSIPPPLSTASTTSNTQFAQPQPLSGTQSSNVNNLFATRSPPPANSTTPSLTALSPPLQAQQAAPQPQASFQQPLRPTGYQASQPNYFGSVPVASTPTQQPSTSVAPAYKPSIAPGAKKPSSGADPFAMLAGGGLGKKSNTTQKGPTMADLSKQKAQAGIWGAPATSSNSGQGNTGGGYNNLLG